MEKDDDAAPAAAAEEEEEEEEVVNKTSDPLIMSDAAKRVWLVKIPAFLEDTLRAQPLGKRVGTLRVEDAAHAGAAPRVTLRVVSDASTRDTPKEYTLNVRAADESWHVIGESARDGAKRAVGSVLLKADATPAITAEYRRILKRRSEKDRTSTAHKIQRLESIEVAGQDTTAAERVRAGSFKLAPPATSTAAKLAAKMSRVHNKRFQTMSDDEYASELLRLFHETPYWSSRDLDLRLNQPIAMLKAQLASLCVYNKAGANKGKYELKPEFLASVDDALSKRAKTAAAAAAAAATTSSAAAADDDVPEELLELEREEREEAARLQAMEDALYDDQ